MLMPSRTKFRKVRKGRIHGGTASAMSSIAYGRYGLVSLESERITARPVNAAAHPGGRPMKTTPSSRCCVHRLNLVCIWRP